MCGILDELNALRQQIQDLTENNYGKQEGCIALKLYEIVICKEQKISLKNLKKLKIVSLKVYF